MTPEQEILQDALAAARQRVDRFANELRTHGRWLPLDPGTDWSDPSDALTTEMAAFTKRYEMTQDVVTRRLFRSVLAVRGTMLRTQALAQVMEAMAALGVVTDAARWEEITKLRNSFAHDYMLTFAKLVPLLNQAWVFAPDLIDMVARVERHVAAHGLLEPAGEQD